MTNRTYIVYDSVSVYFRARYICTLFIVWNTPSICYFFVEVWQLIDQ